MSRIEKKKRKKEELSNKILKFFEILGTILGIIDVIIALTEYIK